LCSSSIKWWPQNRNRHFSPQVNHERRNSQQPDARSQGAAAPDAAGVKQFFTETLPRNIRRAVTWPLRLSLPAKIGWVLFLFLLLMTIFVLIFLANQERYVRLHVALNWYWYAGVGELMILIPWLVYRSLKLWQMGEPARFPEMEFAWQAGLKALEENGLEITSIPLFLILGSSNERQEQVLMQNSGQSFRVEGVPRGPAPIHWYANPDCIFLVCSDVGSLSALGRKVHEQLNEASPIPSSKSESTFTAHSPASPQPPAEPEPADAQLGTLNLDSYAKATAPPSAPSEPDNIQGTMMFDEEGSKPSKPAQRPAASAPQLPAASPKPRSRPPADTQVPFEPVTLSSQENSEQRRRLYYLGQKLAQSRFPFCPHNGILTLLSFRCIELNREQARELEGAVRGDLDVLRTSTRLRSPVTALIVDLEDEPGFAEMVSRVGPQRAYSQRFGRGYSLEKKATAEELAALSQHVAGAFEDWIYMLFREQDALYRPGNQQLFALLCKIRCRLKGRLTDILADGFGSEEGTEGSRTRNLFSGCYFSSIGTDAAESAFCKGVFEKLIDEQEQVEWTEEADELEQRYRFSIKIAVGLLILMTASLILLGTLF